MHLDAILRAPLSGRRRQCRRHGGGELDVGTRGVPTVFAGLVDRAGGIPHRSRGPLGIGDHLGALVLDGLELADRPAELLADLGVARRGVGRPARHADGFGGQQRRHQRVRGAHAQVRQDDVVADLHGVGPHVGDGPQRVQAFHRLDLELVGAQHHPRLAAVDRDGQHQQRRLRGGGDRAELAADHQRTALPGGGQRAAIQAVGGDLGAGCQPGEHLGVRVVRGDQRAGDRGRNEGARHRPVAEFREHDGQLENAEALPADGFRQMNALQALLGRGLPVRRRVLDLRLHRLVQRLGRGDARHQRSHGIGQFLMLGIYRDRHWSPSVAAGRRLGQVPSKLTTSRLVDDITYRHRLPIHPAMMSACSLRAPGW